MYYVLVRQSKPQGGVKEVKRTLEEEGQKVKEVLNRYDVRVRGFVPSRDATRFSAIEDTRIPDNVVRPMKSDLGRVGYGMKGPFDSRGDVYRFWENG